MPKISSNLLPPQILPPQNSNWINVTNWQTLPAGPGVYKFYDKKQQLIYIGKAKNLQKRVGSYFGKKQQAHIKTSKMISAAYWVEPTLVLSEYDALLLENSLIKAHKPRYNILLKDDKDYPYLCLTNEQFPQLTITRQIDTKKGYYYGPFTELTTLNHLLELIKTLYPLRTCKHALTTENIQRKTYKVCLDYHIGNCRGPCVGLQTADEYAQNIQQIQHLLKGQFQSIKQNLQTKMHDAAKVYDYEKAQDCKNKLDALAKYTSKSVVVNHKLGDLDVFGITSDDKVVYLSYLQVRHGSISFTKTEAIQKKLEEPDEEILPLLILSLMKQYNSIVNQVLVNLTISIDLVGVTVITPQAGDKKKLVQIALQNSFFLKKERFIRTHQRKTENSKTLILLQQDLQLNSVPNHIECFDNSNTQGTNPVAAMSCFLRGKPAIQQYRHFHIKTVEGPNDFASMREVVARRYSKILEEQGTLPDLIVIDGGKGQLSAAADALRDLNIYDKIPIIGIAKRLEEIYFPHDQYPLCISKKSPSLKLLQHIRNEAHRFAIKFHRNIRSKSALQGELEQIRGLGPKTIQKLLTNFKSVQGIRYASMDSLIKEVGITKAKIVKSNLSQESGPMEEDGRPCVSALYSDSDLKS